MGEKWESSEEEFPRVVTTLSSILQRVAEMNDDSSEACSSESVFHGMRKPGISIKSYLERIFKYAGCSPACFVLAYVYLDRFTHHRRHLTIHSFNVHRLLITSILLATKFLDDIYYNNAYFAKVGGISMAEMNLLEIDFLFGIQFELNVTPIVFNSYCSILQNEMSFGSPNAGPRLHCFLAEEEGSTCKQNQLAENNTDTTMQCS
ncbi:hypothetical protein J5N97_025197 [Dioscorea zingiberensis]|uniref:Cyclin n=1 Tax=Dioscorea zingiberensis TaxID=325984 RepID=A0A9D5H9N6_9LILI|nr:hypothetical protein J5N97_025197 [Dioscorea zingiberensis]